MGKLIPLYDTCTATQTVEVHHRYELFQKRTSTYVETGFSYGEGETLDGKDLLKGKYLGSFYNCPVRGVVELGRLSTPKILKHQDLGVKEKDITGYDYACTIKKLETVSEDVTEYLEVRNVLSYVTVGIGNYSVGCLSDRETRKVRCAKGEGYRNEKITVERFLDRIATEDDFFDNGQELRGLPFATEDKLTRAELARIEAKYTPLAAGLRKFDYFNSYEERAVELGHTLYVKPEKEEEDEKPQEDAPEKGLRRTGGTSLEGFFKDIKL